MTDTVLKETIEDNLIDRTISSLPEIAYLYGLVNLKSSFEEVPDDLKDNIGIDELRYLKPLSRDEMFENKPEADDSDKSEAIVINIDVSDVENPSFESIDTLTLNSGTDIAYRLAHVPNTTNATDFSVTQFTGTSGSSIKEIAGYRDGFYGQGNIIDRFTFWSYGRNEELQETQLCKDVREQYDSKGYLRAMQLLGQDQEELEKIQEEFLTSLSLNINITSEKIKNGLTEKTLDKLADIDRDPEFITVKFIDEEDEYWPAEVKSVLQLGVELSRKNKQKGSSKTEGSEGEGFDYINSDEKTTVVGGTTSIFRMWNRKKSTTFPNLDEQESWRDRPFTVDTSVQMELGEDEIQKYSYTHSVPFTIYYIPYPQQCSTYKQFEEFYERLDSAFDGDESFGSSKHPLSQLTNSNDEDNYGMIEFDNIYSIFVEKVQNTVWNIIAEPGNIKYSQLIEFLNHIQKSSLEKYEAINSLHDAHSNLYGESEDFEDKSLDEIKKHIHKNGYNSKLIFDQFDHHTEILVYAFFKDIYNSSKNIKDNQRNLLTGGIFYDHLNQPPIGSGGNTSYTDIGTSNPPTKMHQALLEGHKINKSLFLPDFINTLIKQQRKSFENNSDLVFKSYMYEQYALINALEKSGYINEWIGTPKFKANNKNLTNMETNKKDNREKELDEFIQDHSLLNNNADARSVFVLGGIIGRLSEYQSRRQGVSRTLTEQFPIESLNKGSIKRTVWKVLDKNNTYSKMENISEMNSRYTKHLRNSMLVDDDELGLSIDELRWLYALGISYGAQDFNKTNSKDEEESEEEIAE